MRERAATGYHKVILVEGKALHGRRKQRQQAAEIALADAQPLQVGGVHGSARELPPRAFAVVEEGEYRRLGPAGGDRREGTLGAATDQQVVVHERDARAAAAIDCRRHAVAGGRGGGRAPRRRRAHWPFPPSTIGAVRITSFMSFHSDQSSTYR